MKLKATILLVLTTSSKILNDIKVRVFLWINIQKKHLCSRDKNYYYSSKWNIPVINMILGSRDMIKVSKNVSL